MRHDRRVTTSADTSPPTSATQLLHRGLPLPDRYQRLLLQWASATTTASTVQVGRTAASAIPAYLHHWAVQRVRTLAVRSPTDTAATTTLTTAITSLPADSVTLTGSLTFSGVFFASLSFRFRRPDVHYETEMCVHDEALYKSTFTYFAVELFRQPTSSLLDGQARRLVKSIPVLGWTGETDWESPPLPLVFTEGKSEIWPRFWPSFLSVALVLKQSAMLEIENIL